MHVRNYNKISCMCYGKNKKKKKEKVEPVDIVVRLIKDYPNGVHVWCYVSKKKSQQFIKIIFT